jgi:predicted metal-dependent phosphoesterase TrpH
VIDLHLHTTASDGRSAPDALVREAAAAGLRTIAVTDHDTLAGLDLAEAAARRARIGFVRGIEITAVHDGRDVHVLGYYVDAPDQAFLSFLAEQRRDRRRRVTEMLARLEALGAPLDAATVFDESDSAHERAIGRPALARALVQAGHAASVNDAFDRFLGNRGAAFVPRRGAAPAAVVGHLVRIGAIVALAHPGKTRRDELLPELAQAGMAALEVYHPDHDPADVARYADLARALGLLPTGGSDYHGPDSGRAESLGRVTLPAEAFAALDSHVSRLRLR